MDNILPSAPDKVILFFNRQPISFPPHQTTCSCYITDTSAIPILSSYRPLICPLPVDWAKRILHDGLSTVQKSVGPRFTGTAAQKGNRVCTTEERFELINHIWSEDPFTSIATSAGISPGRLCTWVHNYKETGYIGLIDCRKKWKPKESHMNKHKHNQPGKHKESEHEELIRLRTENKLFKAENAAKKK